MEAMPSPDSPNNENQVSITAPPVVTDPSQPDRTFIYWVKKLLVCNPFYLVSAALLLYGFYLVSTDANFPGREIAQLGFNFGSLQVYELLLVTTALLLARRRIWYDSNLLIFLENLLILVPFILINQYALNDSIDRHIVWTMCAIGGGMAFLRFGGLKRFHRDLNLPRGLLINGLVLLLVNVALPLIYRSVNDSKVGTKPTDGAAFEMNQYSWFIILPGIMALANCLPRPAQNSDLLPQRRWVPTGLFTLWMAGTIVHLYSLGYVYDFDWKVPFLIVPLWVLAWTFFNRHGDFLKVAGLRHALLIPPALTTLLAARYSMPLLFMLLTALNILFYLYILLKEQSNRMTQQLLILSSCSLGLAFLSQFQAQLPPGITTGKCTLAVMAAYACCWITISRSPKLGVLGALIVGIGAGVCFERHFDGPHFGIQVGLLFLMLHSLLWKDAMHPSAAGARIFACSLWALHSLILVSSKWPDAGVVVCTGAALVLAICGISKLIRGTRPPLVLPITAGIVMIMHPANVVAIKAQSTPIGLWVIASSFLLFALGTLLALTRSKWNPTVTIPASPVKTPPTN